MSFDILKHVTSLPQRQDSVSDQLADLTRVANKLGLYDAADALRQMFGNKVLDNLKYGCHVDLEPYDDMIPDDCVIDSGDVDDCVYAKRGMVKEQCEYWKIITKKT
jgi:hypothetical protein